MKDQEYKYDDYEFEENWRNLFFLQQLAAHEKSNTSYEFLVDLSSVHNLYSANIPQPNPITNRAMYIIDTLNKLGVKYSLDIFEAQGGNDITWGNSSYSSHKLVNIIAEPNPQVTGPAIVFCAHHDVMNVHSQNAQDNSASVCNLLRLSSLIKTSKDEHQRTIILFSDSEEISAKGANRFAKKSSSIKGSRNISHEIYGEISAVINLELTGNGTIIWSDCEKNKSEDELHISLETTLGHNIQKLRTPPSDAIAFRRYKYPVLCIGILPEYDMKKHDTWRICHSIDDTIEKCNGTDMENFTKFLFNITKKPIITTDNGNQNQTEELKKI